MPLWGWLNTVLIYAQTAMLPAVAIAVGIAVMALVSSQHRRRHRHPTRQPRGGRFPTATTQSQAARTVLTAGMLDVAAEARGALAKVGGLAAQHRVTLEIAVPLGLTASLDQHVFREVLHDLLVHAIGDGAAGRVLLGAYPSGEELHVSITDDGSDTELATQQEALRPVERLAAVLGATLGIETWPRQGTTVVLRLPARGTASRAAPTIGPASVSTPEATPRPATTATTR